MQAVLLRVGIDTGSGGIHSPLFKDGSFELIPIPDKFRKTGVSSQTYGNTVGRYGRKFIKYFPKQLQNKRHDMAIHLDPDFETFTYGDPTLLKSRLRKLEMGDLLVFYAGLKGWKFQSEPALYIVGYFEVAKSGFATAFSKKELRNNFRNNFHVRHRPVFEDQKDRLVLVKGGRKSRLLKKAMLISATGKDRSGRPLQVLSPKMQKIFGDFDGRISIQRCPPRWVRPEFVRKAAKFVGSLRKSVG